MNSNNQCPENEKVGCDPSRVETPPSSQCTKANSKLKQGLQDLEEKVRLPDGTTVRFRDLKHNQVIRQSTHLKIKAKFNKRTGSLSFQIYGRLPVAKQTSNSDSGSSEGAVTTSS